MNRLAEIRALERAALQLPSALLRRRCESLFEIAEMNHRLPVVLVHGYAGTAAVWAPLRKALAEAGFGHIASLNYNSILEHPLAVAAELVHQAWQATASTGMPGVHLIGHSLGGLIVRHAASSSPLAAITTTAITVASPHRGAPLARVAPGRCARLMHPPQKQPAVLPSRHDCGRARGIELMPTRWLAYYSNGDRIVPPMSARLDDPRLGPTNLLIPDCGHMTICGDARLIRSVVTELMRSELSTAPAIFADVPANAA